MAMAKGPWVLQGGNHGLFGLCYRKLGDLISMIESTTMDGAGGVQESSRHPWPSNWLK